MKYPIPMMIRVTNIPKLNHKKDLEFLGCGTVIIGCKGLLFDV